MTVKARAKIFPHFWYAKEAEEAASLYTSIFPVTRTVTPRSLQTTSARSARHRMTARTRRCSLSRITGAAGAAEILGVKPSTLNFRMRKLGLLDELRSARTRTRAAAPD